MEAVTLVSAVLVVVGLAGVVIPVLPGLLLVWLGIAVWAFERMDASAWVVLGAASLVLAAGTIVKYLLPGRRLRENGIGWTTLALGAALGVAGFFVVPIIGLPLGFVLGIYLSEYARARDAARAWAATKRALAAVGWSILIELAAGLIATGIWIGGLLATG